MLLRLKSILACAISAVLLMTVSTFAAENPGQPGAPVVLKEVKVVARRVAENVQRVPLAVTVLSGKTIQQLGITDLNGLQENMPGVNLCCSAFFSPSVSIRGITTANSFIGAPTYFAGVPVPSQGYGNMFDLNNFEILKGPQGTLFGQSSVAGAFVYQPNMPSKKLGGYLSVSAGDYSRRTIEGAVDLPLIRNHLYVRLAAISNERGGYLHDLSNNRNYGNVDYWILRPSVLWRITDNLTNYTLFQYSYAQDNGNAGVMFILSDINPNINDASLGSLTTYLNGGNTQAFYSLAWPMLELQNRLGPYKVVGTAVGCSSGAFGPALPKVPVTSLVPQGTACPYDSYLDRRLVNTTTWRIGGNWTAKNIFGWDTSSQTMQPIDFNLTPLVLVQGAIQESGGGPLQNYPIDGPRIWSDEIQAHGSIGRFDITTGIFHSRQTQNQRTYSSFNTIESLTYSDASTASDALYGQVNIRLPHRLTATVGARYDVDKIQETAIAYTPQTQAPLGPIVLSNQPSGHATFHNVSYTVGLQYQFKPSTMFYSTLSRGYSAGGFQGYGVAGPYFKPEVLTNLETGVKSTFQVGNVAARFDASYYYGWFSDAQVTSFEQYATAGGGSAAGFVTTNAAQAAIRGFETQLTILPFNSLEIDSWFAYNNNVYTKYEGTNPYTGAAFNYASTPFRLDPHIKFGVRLTYYPPLYLLGVPQSAGRVSLTANFAHTSAQFDGSPSQPMTPQDPANPDTGTVCTRQRTVANGYPAALADGSTVWVDCIPSYNNLDVGAQWQDVLGHGGLSASLMITNVTDNITTSSAGALDELVGARATGIAPPRMWFLTLKQTF